MQKYFLLLFLLLTADLYSQTMYVDNELFGVSLIGSAVQHNEESGTRIYNSYGYGIGLTLLKSFDIGLTAFKSKDFKNSDRMKSTVITNLDVHFKNKNFTLVINTAYSNSEGHSEFLLGASIYKRFQLLKESFNIYPTLSGGLILNSGPAIGIGVSAEKIINNNFSIILSPGFNISSKRNQIIIGAEFLIK